MVTTKHAVSFAVGGSSQGNRTPARTVLLNRKSLVSHHAVLLLLSKTCLYYCFSDTRVDIAFSCVVMSDFGLAWVWEGCLMLAERATKSAMLRQSKATTGYYTFRGYFFTSVPGTVPGGLSSSLSRVSPSLHRHPLPELPGQLELTSRMSGKGARGRAMDTHKVDCRY